MIEFVTKGNVFTDDEIDLIMAENAKVAYHIK